MLARRNAWFVQQENAFKLAISRELHRIWSKVLEEPVPPNLQRLIQHLEQVTTPVPAESNGRAGLRRLCPGAVIPPSWALVGSRLESAEEPHRADRTV